MGKKRPYAGCGSRDQGGKAEAQAHAPAAFTTSTMQQESVGKLNFGAKKTMMLAQQLYEGLDIGDRGQVGLITYMRTDSTRINDDMIKSAREYIGRTYGKEYVPAKAHVYKSKASSQDAHEAVRPTSLELMPQTVAPFLTRDQLRLYTLIWNRFLASQMTPVETEHVSVTVESGIYELKAAGYTVLFKGFTELYEEAKKTMTPKSCRLLPKARLSIIGELKRRSTLRSRRRGIRKRA